MARQVAETTTAIGRGWRYGEEGKRDLRLDLLRGFAVFAMVVDHIGGASWLYRLTGGNRFFVSAAEGFVFLSGTVVGIVYGGLVQTRGLRVAVNKLLQRAWLLYVLAVWLALSTALVATILGDPIGRPFAVNPVRFILDVVTLQRTFYLVDVLLLYLFAMVVATGALALLSQGWWWLVALSSWALWAAYQIAPTAVQVPWPIADNPVFPFAPWQVLFFTGLILGYHRKWIAEHVVTRLPASPLRDDYLLLLSAAVGVLIWLSQTNAAAFKRFVPGGNAAAVLDAWFLKSQLPLPRLLAAAIVFTFAWVLVTRCWGPIRRVAGPFLLTLGQGALYAYAAHLFLAALVYFAVVEVVGAGPNGAYPSLSSGVNAALQLASLAILWYFTRVRFLQGLVAPLGGPPLARIEPRWKGRIGTRPADSLLVFLLLVLVLLPTVIPPSAIAWATTARARGISTLTPVPRVKVTDDAPGWTLGASGGDGTLILPESTVTAPRSVAGAVTGNAVSLVTTPTSAAGTATGTATPVPSSSPTVAAASGGTAPTPTATGRLVDGSFFSTSLEQTMPYGIYLPPGYDGGTARYPVLYMLHGAGGHYSEWVGYGLADTTERLINTGQIGPLIIVFPQGDTSYFVNHTGTDDELWGDYVTFDLVAHIDTTYRTLPTRDARAIGGLSMGAFGALALAFAHPDVFGAVGAHSPSLRTFEEAPPTLARTSLGYAAIDPMALAKVLDPTTAPKVWIDVGNLDQWVERTTYLKDLLRGRGIYPVYSENDGGHDGDYWFKNEERYLRFYNGALTPAQVP